MPSSSPLGGGARPRTRFSDIVSEGGRSAVRAPLIFAGNISSGDGRAEILLLFHPLCRVGAGEHDDLSAVFSRTPRSEGGCRWGQEERPANAGQTHTRNRNPDRARREVNVSRGPLWEKGDARGKNKKVRGRGEI